MCPLQGRGQRGPQGERLGKVGPKKTAGRHLVCHRPQRMSLRQRIERESPEPKGHRGLEVRAPSSPERKASRMYPRLDNPLRPTALSLVSPWLRESKSYQPSFLPSPDSRSPQAPGKKKALWVLAHPRALGLSQPRQEPATSAACLGMSAWWCAAVYIYLDIV